MARSNGVPPGVKMEVRPAVISGPSGSGKSTLVKRLMKEFTGCFALSVSHTTRRPREGEENGKDYYFVTREEFEEAIKQDEFIEYAEFSGNLYGTSKMAITQVSHSGRICLLDLELQGVQSIKRTGLNPRYIFVKTPSIAELERRLHSRGTETVESLAKRIEMASSALDYASTPDSYDLIIENDYLDVAYEKLKSVFLEDIKRIQAAK